MLNLYYWAHIKILMLCVTSFKYGAMLIYPKIKYLNVYDLNYLPQLFIFVCITRPKLKI